MPPPINRRYDLAVMVHQHNGDPDEDCDVYVGDVLATRCPKAAVSGRVRALLLAAVKDMELRYG